MSQQEIAALQSAISAQGELINDLARQIRELKDATKPMIEAFSVATSMGKWSKRLLVYISVVLGTILAFKELFKK